MRVRMEANASGSLCTSIPPSYSTGLMARPLGCSTLLRYGFALFERIYREINSALRTILRIHNFCSSLYKTPSSELLHLLLTCRWSASCCIPTNQIPLPFSLASLCALSSARYPRNTPSVTLQAASRLGDHFRALLLSVLQRLQLAKTPTIIQVSSPSPSL
jgi:hypothetical protein